MVKKNLSYPTSMQYMDNLHFYDTINHVTGVQEDADPVTTNGSIDYAGTTGREMAVEYNEWGISRH